MANSSDWPSAFAALADAPASAPGWLALIGETDTFHETLPVRSVDSAPAPSPPAETGPAAPSGHDIDQALAAARAEGEAAGRAAAHAEAEAAAARQRALRLAFRTLDEAAMATLAEELADTVIALCEGVLGSHAADRAALLERCRAAAARLGGAAGMLRLHLHPDDLAGLAPEALDGWDAVADPALEPGALLIEGPDGAVRDGPADWRRAIAAAVRG